VADHQAIHHYHQAQLRSPAAALFNVRADPQIYPARAATLSR
jgi:hypothetical protein